MEKVFIAGLWRFHAGRGVNNDFVFMSLEKYTADLVDVIDTYKYVNLDISRMVNMFNLRSVNQRRVVPPAQQNIEGTLSSSLGQDNAYFHK